LLHLLTTAYVQVFGCRQHWSQPTLGRPASEKRQGTKSRQEVVPGQYRRGRWSRSAMGIWARARARES